MEKKDKPYFICVGAQKAGTTTLYKLLSNTEGVKMPRKKEIHYFDLNYEMGMQWYTNHFAYKGRNEISGDITPYYIFHEKCPKRIARDCPDSKIIILLRDPVERTISHINHAIEHGYETLDPIQAVEEEARRLASGSNYSHQKHSYVARSLYEVQLRRYESYIDSKNIIIIKSEDMYSKNEKVLYEIGDFLNIDRGQMPTNIPHENRKKSNEIKGEEELRLILEMKLEGTKRIIKNRYGITW